MSDKFDTEMTKLRSDVAAQTTVIASATQAFQGLAARLVTAEAAAKAAGATDSQIAGVTSLREQLETNTASLAAAIPANTDSTPVTVTTTPPAPAATIPPTNTDPAPVVVTADTAALAANQAR